MLFFNGMKKIRPLTLLGLLIVAAVIYLIQSKLQQPEIVTIKPQTPKVEVVEVQTDNTAKTEKEYKFSLTPEPVFPDSK